MMERTFAVAALLVFAASAPVVVPGSAAAHAIVTGGGGGGGGGAGPAARTEVSAAQYRILLRQCRYADTRRARRQCRQAVKTRYRVGAWNPRLDCRTYSGITVCGRLKLNKRERRCVAYLVKAGLTRRRAEVECYAFV
ncbi:hypothetical protein Skr01_69800 [Sphaerisporangium krabiense]|uniref:Uncharacterized protein n=1 Tax=Sphaerisporangium krabiense TaxID=763782 RepID=A0A7W8Z6Y0_9ACTN|nr:hypothetical protein [Sphaerisporangium krabiense]MBB5628365.1 hypothetical protein [Sphaerisporangium krabiense]GII66895.1 hypothetical protein Skr01_69800 [Sphaerisporangium krabiense]